MITSLNTGVIWKFSGSDLSSCYPLWQGFLCDCRGGSYVVSEIFLKEFGFNGTIHEKLVILELCLTCRTTPLMSLYQIVLVMCSSFPESICELANLQEFNLRYIFLFGHIWCILNDSFPVLKTLDLRENYFVDQLDDILLPMNCSDIFPFPCYGRGVLELYYNNFDGDATSLPQLNLNDNPNLGSLTGLIFSCVKLEILSFYESVVTGTFPLSIFMGHCLLARTIGTKH